MNSESLNIPPFEDALSEFKTPPHSVAAEQSLLGALMLDNQAWDIVSDILVAEDFFKAAHRRIFQTLIDLLKKGETFDVITVNDALELAGSSQEVGGIAYLGQLVDNTPGVANIRAYAEAIRDRSIMRQLISAANKISDGSFNPKGKDTDQILSEAEKYILDIAEKRDKEGNGIEWVEPVINRAFENIKELFRNKGQMTGLSTGFVDLDKLTNGLQKSDLVIVAARPSMGKTALCMNIAEHAALHQDSPVVVFSLEMPSDQLMLRMMACLGKVELTKVRSGQLNQGELKSLMAAMTKLQKRPLFLDETAGLSPTEMRSRLRRLKSQEKKNPALVIIDYLQLMTTGKQSQSRTDEVSEISRQLKGIAKEFECPVVALSQLSRNVEKRDVKRPQMSDLRDSGAIEQDADIIAFIYRDDYYEKENSKRPGEADIIIAKHRNGPIGDVSLTFESKYTRFDNLARSSQRQAAEDAGF